MRAKNVFFLKDATKGYSLFEAVLAVGLLAVIASIASTSFLKTAPKYWLKNAAWEINAQLNFARHKAIFEGAKVRVRFSQSSYIIETYDESQKVWKREREHLLKGVTLRANNSPMFHPEGTVSDLTSIDVFNSWGRCRISLAISGRIKVTSIQLRS